MGMYLIVNSSKAKKHLEDLKKTGSKAVLDRIKRIYEDLEKHPETGIGKPERLKHQYSGRWSREIDKKNRIMYEIVEDRVIVYVFSVNGHYSDH
jgi:toxin YoeB